MSYILQILQKIYIFEKNLYNLVFLFLFQKIFNKILKNIYKNI